MPPKKNVKNASRYATVSIPKPRAPTPPPVIEEKEEEVIVDPYSYYTTETFYFEKELPANLSFRYVGKFDSGGSSSGDADCTIECLGQEEVPSFKYERKTHRCGRDYNETYYAGDIKFMGTNYSPATQGWVLSSGETDVKRTPDEVRKMYAYRVTYKYLPHKYYTKVYLTLDREYTSLVIGEL